MCDAIYVYIIYLYIVRAILTVIVSAIFPEITDEELDMFTDLALLGYLHLHYALFVCIGSDSDIKALVVLNLTTIFVVDIMSIITTMSNKSEISDGHFQFWIISIIILNSSWFVACWVIIRGSGDSLFEPQDDVVVHDDGRVEDNRGVDNQAIEDINCVLYQPYYRFRNKQCSICIVDYEINDAVSVLPVCHHTFHKECISEWLKRNTTCPHCRRNITRGDVQTEKGKTSDDIVAFIRKSTLDRNGRDSFQVTK